MEDRAAFKNFVRVEPAMFLELLNHLGPAIVQQITFYGKALHPRLRLVITLRFLATGDSYHSLMYGFCVPHNTISCHYPRSVLSHHPGISRGSDCLSHHTPRMVSDSQSLQSEMAVSSCPRRPGLETCYHSMSPKKAVLCIIITRDSIPSCCWVW